MKIKEINIKNFRSIKEDTITFDDLTVLVGKNGAGKSSFLHAIRYFFEPESIAETEDFYNEEINNKSIEIKITFERLIKEEVQNFKKYTREGILTVNKEYKEPGKGKYYGYTKQVIEFKKILDSGKGALEMRADFAKLSSQDKFKGLNKASSYNNMIEIMDNWIEKHPSQCEILPVGTEFFGFVGRYNLNDYTKCVFIPAVKEAGEEIDKGSLKELMNVLVVRKIGANEEVKKFNESFQKQAEEIFKVANFPELANLSNELTSTLDRLSPGSAIDINWGEIKAPDITVPPYITKITEDEYKGDPSRKGHGLQRALIITLMQHLQITKISEALQQLTEEKEETFSSSLDLIFVIEEPELFLHPHRARYLSKILYNLSMEKSTTGKNQVIYSTHSPFFVGIDRFEEIRMIIKEESANAKLPKKSISTQCSYEDIIAKLKKTCDISDDIAPRASFLYRCRPVVNSIVNEGLFANTVLVVEGLTEVGIFTKLSEILEKEWDEEGIVVIPSFGKNNIDRLVTIFDGFKIPTYFVFDADSDEDDQRKREKISEKNIKFQKYLGGIEEAKDFPDSKAYDNFAVFDTNIEDEIKDILGEEEFCSIRDKIAKDLGIFGKERLKNLLKNIEGASDFIEEVYKRGHKLTILEEIINRTTNLVR